MSSVEELENKWLQARYAADYKTRKPMYEIDSRYRSEVDKLEFELQLARQASTAPAVRAPTVHQADIDLLNRAAAVDGGRTYFNDRNFRHKIESLRAEVYAGGSIPENVRAATEADLAARGAK